MSKWIGERISTADHPEYTTIIIFPKLERWKEWLLTLWVMGFTFIGAVMIYMLLGGLYSTAVVADNVEDVRDQQLVYTIVFLGFWAYFEYKTVKALTWYKFGKEFIKINRDALTVKRSTFGYGKAHHYFFENIKNFHQEKPDNTSMGHFFENAYWSLGTDSLHFDYFGKSRGFGRKLNEKDARLLMRYIDDRTKTLRKKKPVS
jgi:hypothetical protein